MRQGSSYQGCFPTGRHYAGIADRIAKMIQNVEGLCSEFSPGRNWFDIPIAVIDFETTGTDKDVDRIIEIGIVGFKNGEMISREGLLVNPGMPIPPDSTAVHGITDEEVADAPSFETLMPKVIELLEGHIPVAYNAGFDRGFLLAEVERAKHMLNPEIDLPPAMRADVEWIDPLVWARELLKNQKSRKLGDVAKFYGVPLEQAHRAAGDAEATGRVLLAMSPQMPNVYGELIRLQKRYGAFQQAEMANWKRFRK